MTMKKFVLVNALALGLVFSPVIRAEEAAAPADEAKMEKKSDCEGDCDCSKCKKGKNHKSCKKCKTKHKHKDGEAAHGHEQGHEHGDAKTPEAQAH
jgi:hypothetical protein